MIRHTAQKMETVYDRLAQKRETKAMPTTTLLQVNQQQQSDEEGDRQESEGSTSNVNKIHKQQ